MNRRPLALFAALTVEPTGPVTDYGATVTHWQHDRTPAYKGSYTGEAERPSYSYIVDVRYSWPHTDVYDH